MLKATCLLEGPASLLLQLEPLSGPRFHFVDHWRRADVTAARGPKGVLSGTGDWPENIEPLSGPLIYTSACRLLFSLWSKDFKSVSRI